MLKAINFILKANKPIFNTSSFFSTVKYRRRPQQRIFGPVPLPRLYYYRSEIDPFLFRLLSLGYIRMNFSDEKAKYLNLSHKEKRKYYYVKSKYVTLDDIKPWSEYAKTVTPHDCPPVCSKNSQLNEKVSMFVGDITALEVDAIVNAANHLLRGGGGVDGAIHRAAGPSLLEECKTLQNCDTGDAKITGGYKLPAKYVIHTVGPVGEMPDDLASCYQKSLNLALANNLRTIAFPCISTGVFGYPNEKAAPVAIKTVRKMLEENLSSFDRIIFCLFVPVDVAIYQALLQEYFPV